MNIQIIGDSSTDCGDEIKRVLGLTRVPLKINIPDIAHYVDDGSINIPEMIDNMAKCKQASGSACPAPEEFAEKMRKAEACFVITLSAKLSGSYNSACIARDMVLEETPDKKIYVIDSKSASAGQTRIAMALRNWIDGGDDFDTIIKKAEKLVSEMKTLFVLEDLSNLVKNGRISKAAGLLGGVIGLRPIMGDNGNGEIECVEKVRGTQKALSRLCEIIQKGTENKKNLVMVIAHGNCMERAQELKKSIAKLCSKQFDDIIVVPTGGLSTLYAANGGIVLAYA